ncbi:MAG: adenylosuccinate lyase [Verrucomicrobia bacterium]|nr:adenylosuccinate lyase [Verrucomicrobiota bacterium]
MIHYTSPLSDRYASKEMSYLFSPRFKYVTWRKLWVALARAQKKLGLPITDAQIASLASAVETIDLAKAAHYEMTFRHDVMAHIHEFGDQCPEARGIIHLGATSCFVTDNADVIQMQSGLLLLQMKIVQVVRQLSHFAKKHADLPCLSYTHMQSAQPTTVGKRACLWIQDLLLDLRDLHHLLSGVRFLGVKGATGTQASFLSLFDGDSKKVDQLEQLIAEEMGFTRLFSVTGQTYTRKQDTQIAGALAGLAASSHKFATDLRLLAHLKEIEEPFSQTQVGSSAMPYKRNPMRSERICGLARFAISLSENAYYTEATQWLERTLDDSANRRLYLPEMFLAVDGILNLLCNVTNGLIVHPAIIHKHLQEEIPFLATENILMEATSRGKDRQVVHERLRAHSLAASAEIKDHGRPCDLLERIAQDSTIGLSSQEITKCADSHHLIGRADTQVHTFLEQEVSPVLAFYKDLPPYEPCIQR